MSQVSLYTVIQALSSLLFAWSTDPLALAVQSRQLCKHAPPWLPTFPDLPPIILILLLIFPVLLSSFPRSS